MAEQGAQQNITVTIALYGIYFEGRLQTKEAAEDQLKQANEHPERFKLVSNDMRYLLKKAWMEEDQPEPGRGRVMAEYEIDGPATWADLGHRAQDGIIAKQVFGQDSASAGQGLILIVKDGLPVGGSLPHYTTSMDAAWLLVEKMLDKVVFTCEVGDWGNESKYVVITFDRTPAQNEIRTAASTMPEAICLAALKVVGYEIKE